MNNTLTNEQLLKRVDHQIGVVDRRFERSEFRTNQRFDVIEDRLDRHDHQFLELKGSIDDLAIITKNAFDHVDEQFRKIDERFMRVDHQFNQADKRFDKLEERFDTLETLLKKGFGIT